MRITRMKPALFFTLALILSCGGGGGGGSDPDPNGNDDDGGSSTAPVTLTVGTPHSGTISGGNSNFYKFTTTGFSGSYGIGLTAVQADLSWDLYQSSDYSSYFVANCDKHFTALNEICSVTLDASSTLS